MNAKEGTNYPESFLSKPVQCLFQQHSESLVLTSKDPGLFVTPSLTFNWNTLAPLLEELTDSMELRKWSENGDVEGKKEKVSTVVFTSVCRKLWPVLRQAREELLACQHPPEHLWQWTFCAQQLLNCFRELQDDLNAVTPLKMSLLLSSIFERAIGNVYLRKRSSVPFLLRDLLHSEELLGIFGSVPMTISQILLGTPCGFNIRNICWHGFPAPHEIPFEIATSILILISSFGEALKNVNFGSFSPRPQVTSATWELHVNTLLTTQFPAVINNLDDVLNVIELSRVIPKTHYLYWHAVVEHIKQGRYGESLLLLLPALEHLLRCVFCIANSCSERVLLAEQCTFYTTMDEILAENFMNEEGEPQGRNHIRHLLGDKVLEILMDAFSILAGPRIRDKVSHGECDINQVPSEIVNHVLCISMLIVGKLDDISWMNCHADLTAAENGYIAKFHSISLLVSKMQSAVEKLSKIEVLSQLGGTNETSVCTEVKELESQLLKQEFKGSSPSSGCINRKIDDFLRAKVSTLYRSKSDMTIIAALQKVTSMLEVTVGNVQSGLLIRIQCYAEHKLRSRQRKTYHCMLGFLPSLQSAVRCIFLLLLLQLRALPQEKLTYIRTLMKYSENMASLSRIDKNRWEEMKNITSNFCLYSTQIFQSA